MGPLPDPVPAAASVLAAQGGDAGGAGHVLPSMRGVWSTCYVVPIPITAVVSIAGAYGAKVLVKALGGSNEVAGVSGELVKALAESESRIEERLRGIEDALDELLEQRYGAALGKGLRFFLDAVEGAAGNRGRDLEHAREAFIEASAAAKSKLQEALAERYVLLSVLAQGDMALVSVSLAQMECAATAAAFDAMELSEQNTDAAEKLLQRRGVPGRRLGPNALRSARIEVQAAALESVGMCGRLLGEAAVWAPPLGLPPRAAPPTQVSDSPRGLGEVKYRMSTRWEASTKPYWVFEVRSGEVLRIGCLALEFLLATARKKAPRLEVQWVNVSRPPSKPRPRYVARLALSPPLPRPIVMSQPSTDPSPLSFDRGTLSAVKTVSVAAGVAEAELRLRSASRSEIGLDPPGNLSPFIRVTCRN